MRSLVGRAASVLPEPVAERLLPWKRSAFRSAGVATVKKAERRLLIGPVNSAGQAHEWARAASAMPRTSAANVMFRREGDAFSFPADQSVPEIYAVTNRRWQHAQSRAVARFTHVLIESGRRMLGPGGAVRDDIRFFGRKGLRVGLVWHGSDIRIPTIHARTEPDSPFQDGGYVDQGRLEEIALRNLDLAIGSGLPNFVSTPDLLHFLPDATWLPVVVDLAMWEAAATRRVLERDIPVVVHAPSRAGLKGTDMITASLRRMHADGRVDYREVTGVPASQMPAVYGDADIVLDQFSLGIYGVAACEAMAAGRVVISHVSDRVRDAVHSRTGRSLPIVESRAGELEQVLGTVIDDRAEARRVADRGRSFVAHAHDGSLSRAALEPFLAGFGVHGQELVGDLNGVR